MLKTLKQVIQNGGRLTNEQINEVYHLIRPSGILDRVQIEPRVCYYAGQDYTSEIRTVRQCILA